MSNKFILLFFFISGITAIHAQQILTTKDGRQYNATNEWSFICDEYVLTRTFQFQIAKTEKGGILKITAMVTDPSFVIKGTVYIYLEDNTFITCTDKGTKDTTDSRITAFYNFTLPEMNKLKNSAIKSIRINIDGKESKFSSQTGHFTAINKKQYFEFYDKSIRNTFETEKEITNLYSDIK